MTSQTTEDQQTQQQQGQQQPQQEQQQPQQSQQSQEQQHQKPQQWYDQPDFNTTFLSQVSGGGPQLASQVDWAREYFDAIDAQLRSARRVAEISALSSITQQIVAQCAQLVRQQVLTDLRRDYSLMQMQQQPQQQSGSSVSSGSERPSRRSE